MQIHSCLSEILGFWVSKLKKMLKGKNFETISHLFWLPGTEEKRIYRFVRSIRCH